MTRKQKAHRLLHTTEACLNCNYIYSNNKPHQHVRGMYASCEMNVEQN